MKQNNRGDNVYSTTNAYACFVCSATEQTKYIITDVRKHQYEKTRIPFYEYHYLFLLSIFPHSQTEDGKGGKN
jgi:hypothetical protein